MAEIASFGVNVDQNTRLAQNAQDTADDANAKNSANSQQIANMNDPNYLSPFEKPQLEIQMDNFATIYAADKDIATSESIDFTAYEAAYQAYLAYMTPLVADMTTYSPIVRATFNNMVTAVQAEQKRFNAATQAQYNQQMNQAKTDIANGQTKYQALQADAANMKSDAANVATTASQAIASAGFANDTANAAQSSAMAAVNQAGFASDTSVQASQAASSAVAAANEATAGATTAESNAANALTSAATVFNATAKAQSTADNAFSQAQAVGSQASAEIAVQSNATAKAQSTADNAFSQAQAVGSQASAEINSNSTATVTAQSTADNAFSQATTAIDNGKVTSQAVTNLKGGSKLTIAELENGLATKVANSEYASDKIQTASQIASKVDNGAFSTYKTQTADLISSKVATKDFSAYQATTAKAISSKVESSDFNTYKTQTDKAILSKVSSTDFNNLTISNRNLALGTATPFKMTGNGSTNNAKHMYSTSDTIAKGTTVTVTFDITSTKSGGTYVIQFSGGPWQTVLGVGGLPLVSGTQHQSYTFATTADFPDGVQLRLDNVTSDVTVSNFIITESSKEVSWTPAPEDQATVTALTQVKQTVEGIKTDISKKIEKTDLNGYATQDWAQNQINITADGINSNLSSVKTTVDGQTTNINDLKSDSSSFKSQFTTVNDTLGKHTTDISTLQTDSSGFKTQFQTVNDNVGKNATDIGTLQASSKELTTGFNTLTTDNGTNKNDISQLKQTSKEVNSTLETVQTQVQNSAVGTNLLTGTNNAQDYTVSGSGWALGSQSSNGTNASIPCTPGVSYTYSAIVKSTTYDCYPEIQFFDSSKKVIKNSVNLPSKDIGVRKTTAVAPENAAFVGAHMVLNNPSDSQTVVFNSEKLEKGSLATDWCPNPADNATVTALTQVKQTADGAQVLATNNKGDITNLQATAKGLQTSVSNAATKDQLTILSSQLTNKITDLKSSTSSQFTQTSNDINGLVKKGDVVNQFNIDAGGALLQTVGGNTKIVLSAPNVIVDSANPMQIQNANIVGTLTGKTFEAGTITATTKIIGSDIEAALVHSKDNSFSLDGATGDMIGASIHAADNSWGISNAGKIHGISVTASLLDISGDGTGPDYDKNTGHEASPDTSQGIYSRYSYSTTSGYDSKAFGRKIFKNGYLSISGDTYLNRAIVDWSADGGGVYSYDQMVQANALKMRAYNFTGTNSQTDNPSDTEGTLSSRIDITPSTISMGTNWSVSDPNVEISSNGTAVFNTVGTKNIVLNSAHTLEVSDGKDLYFSDSTGKQNFSLHAQRFIQSSLLSLKTDITAIDPHDALNEVVKNDVLSYHYKTDDPSKPKSVSVILDDVNQIPEYYTSNIFKSADGTGRNDGNIVGYLMLSIKDLNSRLQKLEGAN